MINGIVFGCPDVSYQLEITAIQCLILKLFSVFVYVFMSYDMHMSVSPLKIIFCVIIVARIFSHAVRHSVH